MPPQENWLMWAKKLPPDEPFYCAPCRHFTEGLDQMREHLSGAHLHYTPYYCHLCAKRFPYTDMEGFMQHCEALGHPNPFKEYIHDERYDAKMEDLLFELTREVVERKMRDDEREVVSYIGYWWKAP